MRYSKIEEAFFKVLMWIIFSLVSFLLLFIIVIVTLKGASAMNLDMLTKTARGGFYLGKEGGVLHAIAGSFCISGGASIISLFVSVPLVIYLNVYSVKKSVFSRVTRFFMDILTGIPSIVSGTLCFTFMIYIGMKTSLLGGIIAIGLLITPVMCRSLDEIAKQVPADLMTTAFALGSTKLEAGFIVFFRQIIPGIISSFLLAFGRGIGDAAAVLFTAGYTDNMPSSLFEPVASLPLAIFFQLEMPVAEVRARAYASALILTFIILVISISSRMLATRYRKYKV